MRLFGLDITRAKSLPLPQPRSAYMGGASDSFLLGQSFTELVKQGLYQNAVVQGCITAYTMTLSEPDIEVYVNDIEDYNHPLYKLLDRPNKAMSRAQLLSFIAAYVAVGGNCYVVKVRNQQGGTIALYPYHDGQIKPVPSQFEWIDHYEYKVDNITKVIPADDVIHFRSHIIDPLRPHMGMSPILAAARGVDIYAEMEKIIYSTLKNDGMPRGLLSFPPEATMNTQQLDLIREQFGDNYGGAKRGRTAVLSGGAQYERISFNLEELQADNIISRAEVAICQAFRVHPLVAMTYAGLMNSTYSNMEEAFKQFTTLTRVPIWRAWEETLQAAFASEYPTAEIEFDTDDVQALKPDMKDVEASVISQFTSNIITQNEARQALGFEPIAGQDLFTYQLQPDVSGGVVPAVNSIDIEDDADDLPFFEGEVTHDYLGKEMSEDSMHIEWKRQDANLELYAKRIAKDFATVTRKLEAAVISEIKMMGAVETKTDPFNYGFWVRQYISGTKKSVDSLIRAVINDSLEQTGATVEEFGSANFEAVVRTSAALSAANITESVGTIRDELQTIITENANATAAELTDILRKKFDTLSDSRARLIGRTTTTSVSGKTQRSTWTKRNTQITDPKMKIVPVWTTMNDKDVRASHRALNRTTPGSDGAWQVSGVRVEYPADAAATGSDVSVRRFICNCRCVLIPTRAGRV